MSNLREVITDEISKKYPGLDGMVSIVNNSIRFRMTWKTEEQALRFSSEIKDLIRQNFNSRFYVWVRFVDVDEVTDRRIKFDAPTRAPEMVIGKERIDNI